MPGPRVIQGQCPVDLHPLTPVKVSELDDVRAAVAAARAAQPAWAHLGLKPRTQLLTAAAKKMLERRQEAMELLHDEIGKTPGEALMTEAVGPLQLLKDCARVVGPYLGSRKLPLSPLAFPGKSGRVDVVPRGVVGVIAPWNYPLAYFFKPVFPALLCGNTVVLKPSEFAPRTAQWFVDVLSEFLPHGVLSCVQGDREVGQALVRAGIDAVTFTGSYHSGREVAILAAEQMIPCSAELGGKDAAIVLADCRLERTVAGVMQWALHNAGQACGAIDRVYVEAAVADRFVERLGRGVSSLRADTGEPGTYDLGPIAHAKQLQTIEALVADALAKGATLVCGGKRTGKGLGYEPTVLDHCNHTMRVCTEPTFGPVIPVVRVADAEEAVRLANDSLYGLCGSVWSQDGARAAALAARLEVGTAFINNHSFTGGVVAAPWTGVKRTGYGIANSAYGLAHYTRPRTQVVDRSAAPDIYWYPINGTLEELGHRLAEAQLGRIASAVRLPFLMRKRKQQTASHARQLQVPRSALAPAEHPPELPRADTPNRPTRRYRVPLLAFEIRWTRATFEAMFPEDPALRPLAALSPQESTQLMQEFLDTVPPLPRIATRAMIWFVGIAPLFSRRSRVETLESLCHSRWFLPRQMIMVLKSVGAFSHAKTTRILPAAPLSPPVSAPSSPQHADLPTTPAQGPEIGGAQ